MTPQILANFRNACQTVIAESNDEYAKSYAQAGLDMDDDNEVRVQCLYILNNLQHWRGNKARETKDHFHQIGKVLTK